MVAKHEQEKIVFDLAEILHAHSLEISVKYIKSCLKFTSSDCIASHRYFIIIVLFQTLENLRITLDLILLQTNKIYYECLEEILLTVIEHERLKLVDFMIDLRPPNRTRIAHCLDHPERSQSQ
jgi:hypothetical protein